MKTFNINENDAGQRLNKFIEKTYFNVPLSLMYKNIRKQNVKVNHKPSKPQYILKIGDVVSVYGLDEFFKAKYYNFSEKKGVPLNIAYEDSNIIVVYKCKGIKSHPNSSLKDSLIDNIIKYLIFKGEYVPENENSFAPSLCGRLDVNTSGLIMAGKNANALRSLNELNRQGRIKKIYICTVEGILTKNREVLVGYWSKDTAKNKALIKSKVYDSAKKVITEYILLKQLENKAVVKVLLHTGKSHQIRAQMAQIGHPIVGDIKYGSKYKTPQKLSCIGLEFYSKGSFLEYLDGKKITLKTNKA